MITHGIEYDMKLPKTVKLVKEKFEDDFDKIEGKINKTYIDKEDLKYLIEYKENNIKKLKDLYKKDNITVEEYADIEDKVISNDHEILTIADMKKWKKEDDDELKDLQHHRKVLEFFISGNKKITLGEFRKKWFGDNNE